MEKLKYMGTLKQNNVTIKKKINWFVRYTIKKPIIFLTYILVGGVMLLIVATKIKIPVYETYSGICMMQKREYMVVSIEKSVTPETSIYLYTDREEEIWEVNDYEIKDNQLIIHGSVFELIGKKVYIDIECGKITLLEMALLGGK